MHPTAPTTFTFTPPLRVTRPIATPPATIVYGIPSSVSHPGRTAPLETGRRYFTKAFLYFPFYDQASATLPVTTDPSRNPDSGPPPVTGPYRTSLSGANRYRPS
ncbi:unnamed protein product, partial [Ectocarpus fasciculatus]